MKRKYGIESRCLRGRTDELTTLEKARAAGFEAFTTTTIDLESVRALKKKGDELGMEFSFLHAPYRDINTLWEEGEGCRAMMDSILTTIDSAAACDIPTIILHVSEGWNPPPVCDLGLSRFDEVIRYAEEKGVTVALENLHYVGNLTYLMDRYEQRDSVRFCFDTGHEHCYTKTVRWQDIFTTKIVALHISDNLSRPDDDKVTDRDRHWLPFDGTYPYHEMMARLDRYGYEGPLMLEVFRTTREDYREMTDEEYLATCFERVKRIDAINE